MKFAFFKLTASDKSTARTTTTTTIKDQLTKIVKGSGLKSEKTYRPTE